MSPKTGSLILIGIIFCFSNWPITSNASPTFSRVTAQLGYSTGLSTHASSTKSVTSVPKEDSGTSFSHVNPTKTVDRRFVSQAKLFSKSCPIGCSCVRKDYSYWLKNYLLENSIFTKLLTSLTQSIEYPIEYYYPVNISCRITGRTLVIAEQFEALLSLFNMNTTPILMSLECTGNSSVVWNTSDILLVDWFHVKNCNNILPVSLAGSFFSLFGPSMTNISLENTGGVTLNCSQLEHFRQINSIKIIQNKLTYLPSCLFRPSLVYMNLSENNIRDLSEIEFPTNVHSNKLQYLDLCGNDIKQLNQFAKLSVIDLRLCRNSIKELHEKTFVKLERLQSIDLSWNQIFSIESGTFRSQRYLTDLNLKHNSLISLSPDQSPSCPSYVDVRHNKLKYPPFSSHKFETGSAVTISAGNNPFFCDCSVISYRNFILNGQNKDLYIRKKENGEPYFPVRGYPKQLFLNASNLQCSYPALLRGRKLIDVVFNTSCPVIQDCPVLCECSFMKEEKKTIIQCSSQNLTSLPDSAPPGILELDFSDNQITTLPVKVYLKQARSLILSRNALVSVSPGVFDQLAQLIILALDFNSLVVLPETLAHFPLRQNFTLLLNGNPWRCDCDSLWLSHWLSRNKEIISHEDDTTCSDPPDRIGQLVSQVTDEDLQCLSYSYLALAIASGILGLLTLVLVSVFYRYRLETKVFLHTKFDIRPFDRKQNVKEEGETGEEKLFDVFISYCAQDEDWVMGTLVHRLEATKPPFKLCIHHRDFVIGDPIADNIIMATSKSHTTVMVLSKGFVESEWCIFEFQRAHLEMIKDHKCRLVALLLDDIKAEQLPLDLETYLKTNTYLEIGDRWFWPKLMYALPDPTVERANERDILMKDMLNL